MPDYFGNRANDLNQAAAFGQGVGQNLGQAFVQQPLQRLQLVQALANARNQQMFRQSQLQSLDAYRQASLGQRADYQNMENQIRLLQAQSQLGRASHGNFTVDPVTGQMYDRNTGQYLPTEAPPVQGGQAGTGAPTNNAIQQLPSQPSQTLTPQQMNAQSRASEVQNRDFMSLANLYGATLNSTNTMQNDPRFAQMLSNRLYGMPQQGQSLAPTNSFQLSPGNQPPQQFDTNAILQQAQAAIQQGANPNAVRARLQQQYGITNQ